MDIKEFFRVNIKNASKQKPLIFEERGKKKKEKKEEKEAERLRKIESERRREIERNKRQEKEKIQNIENKITCVNNLERNLIQLQNTLDKKKKEFDEYMNKQKNIYENEKKNFRKILKDQIKTSNNEKLAFTKIIKKQEEIILKLSEPSVEPPMPTDYKKIPRCKSKKPVENSAHIHK